MTSRTSRWFPYEPEMWHDNFQTGMLLDDFNLHIVPYRGNGDAYELSVEETPSRQVTNALSLWGNETGADSFIRAVASTLLTEHEVWLEMVFQTDDRDGLPFRPILVHGVRRMATGKLMQIVPAMDAPHYHSHGNTTQEPQTIELDSERMINVALPEKYPSQLLNKLVDDLTETDLHNPLKAQWIMEGMTGQRRDTPAFDVSEAVRTHKLCTAQAALPIGWTARETLYGGERVLNDYYHYWRELRFLHFRSSIRKSAEEALREVLSNAAAKCGFKVSITTSGLYTPPEVEKIICDYEAGKITFSAVNDIIFERRDSTYSRQRDVL